MRRLYRPGHGFAVCFRIPGTPDAPIGKPPVRHELLHCRIRRCRHALRQNSQPSRKLLAGKLPDLLPIEKHASGGWPLYSGQRPQKRRFPHTIRTDDGRALPLRKGDGQILQNVLPCDGDAEMRYLDPHIIIPS